MKSIRGAGRARPPAFSFAAFSQRLKSCQAAHRQSIFFLWRPCLPDPKNDMVLELAVAAGCEAIVTHDQRDFAGTERLGVRIDAPRDLLRILEEPT
ncbi:MAG TPA: PIN domain-containing protein [Thermoanaerobaculia bacterium]